MRKGWCVRHSESHVTFLLILGLFWITEAHFAVKCRQYFSHNRDGEKIRAGHWDAFLSTSLINLSSKNNMDCTSPLDCSLLLLSIKVNQRYRYVHTHKQNTRVHSDTLAQTNGSNSQAIWKAVLFSHLPTYNTPHLCVCFFESFISVASSTVFHGVKIEAIILPNAYLPALYAPSCTRRLLHDEVADMFHTHHPLPYVHWMRLSLRNLY